MLFSHVFIVQHMAIWQRELYILGWCVCMSELYIQFISNEKAMHLYIIFYMKHEIIRNEEKNEVKILFTQ